MSGKVTGFGGVFFKCDDIQKQRDWYAKHLGIEPENWGGKAFKWHPLNDPGTVATTSWSPFKKDTEYFGPSKKDFMINYRVENLLDLLKDLKANGVQVVGEVEEYEYGKFGWIMDPEGNKIELWEPIDGIF